MNLRTKVITLLATIAALVAVPCTDANAETRPVNKITHKQIEACVAEIGRHALFKDATRVVHWVDDLDQLNLEELEIGIRSQAYSDDSDIAISAWEAICVTGTLGNVVSFRIDSVAPRSTPESIRAASAE